MKKIWTKTIIIVIMLVPISVFLHEAGHWIIFELNGVDSWISMQKANIINPEQLTDDIFLISLFGGPIVTITLALISYFILRKYPELSWFFVLGIINATLRIIPTIFGVFRAARTDLRGFSDEGNIVLRLTDSVFLRATIMLLYIAFCIFIIIRIYKTFKFPENFKRKILLLATICVLTVLITMTYPFLDKLIFEL